jgi:hypothetical protein
MTVKRSKTTTNTPQALEKGIEVIWGAYERSEKVGKIAPEELIHALYQDLAEAEKAEQLEVPAREWRCEQDRWLELIREIGGRVTLEATGPERAFLLRQRGLAIQPCEEQVAADFTPEISPAERRRLNWERRQARKG